MSLYKTFKTDTNLETGGIWLEFGFVDEDPTRPIRIHIARAGGSNTRFARILEAKTKAYRRQIQTETIDPKLAEKIFKEVFAESVVLGWMNVQDENGKDMVFSVDTCMKLFTDLPDLYTDVREQAGKAALFREHILEDDSKNS